MPNKSEPYAGVCHYCESSFPQSEILDHLSACEQRAKRLQASEKQKTPSRQIMQLHVQGYDLPQYWMLLEVTADITLKKLDNYLRMVWLECCGHLSVFRIEDESYSIRAEADLGWRSMQRVRLGEVVNEGDWFGYEYDMGDMTALHLGVVGQREGVLAKDRIELMAENNPPDLSCTCGSQAGWVCPECSWEDDGSGWLCSACASKHKCPEEYFLPVVNSPRVGVCAYGRTV